MHRADGRPHSGTSPPLPGACRTVTSGQASTRGQPGAGPARLPSGTSPAESSSTCSAPGSSPKATPLGPPGGHRSYRRTISCGRDSIRHAPGLARPGLGPMSQPGRQGETKIIYPERARCVPPGPALRSVAATRWAAKAEEKRRRASRGRAPGGPAQPFPGYCARSSAPAALPASPAPAPSPPPGRPLAAVAPDLRCPAAADPRTAHRAGRRGAAAGSPPRSRPAHRPGCVPPTVAAIVNSPLSFVSGTRRIHTVCR